MMRDLWSAAILAAIVALSVASSPGAAANPGATVEDVPALVSLPYAEGHETECVLGGPVVALGVLPYVQLAAAAALHGDDGEVTLPVLALGFAFGCSTGEVLSPGLWWMWRYL